MNIWHICETLNLKKKGPDDNILKADAIFTGEGRENVGYGQPTPNTVLLRSSRRINKCSYLITAIIGLVVS